MKHICVAESAAQHQSPSRGASTSENCAAAAASAASRRRNVRRNNGGINNNRVAAKAWRGMASRCGSAKIIAWRNKRHRVSIKINARYSKYQRNNMAGGGGNENRRAAGNENGNQCNGDRWRKWLGCMKLSRRKPGMAAKMAAAKMAASKMKAKNIISKSAYVAFSSKSITAYNIAKPMAQPGGRLGGAKMA
jgi:hypothetical protein